MFSISKKITYTYWRNKIVTNTCRKKKHPKQTVLKKKIPTITKITSKRAIKLKTLYNAPQTENYVIPRNAAQHQTASILKSTCLCQTGHKIPFALKYMYITRIRLFPPINPSSRFVTNAPRDYLLLRATTTTTTTTTVLCTKLKLQALMTSV